MLATELSVRTERGGCPRVQVRTLRPSGTACLRSSGGRRAGSGEGQPGDRTFWAGLWAVGGGRAGRGRPCRSVSQATKALATRTSAQRGSVSARSLGDRVCPAGVPRWGQDGTRPSPATMGPARHRTAAVTVGRGTVDISPCTTTQPFRLHKRRPGLCTHRQACLSLQPGELP